jgi:hypothetical protein
MGCRSTKQPRGSGAEGQQMAIAIDNYTDTLMWKLCKFYRVGGNAIWVLWREQELTLSLRRVSRDSIGSNTRAGTYHDHQSTYILSSTQL